MVTVQKRTENVSYEIQTLAAGSVLRDLNAPTRHSRFGDLCKLLHAMPALIINMITI